MRVRSVLLVVVAAGLIPAARLLSQQKSAPQHAALTSQEERDLLHAGADWKLVADHLPDPKTATAAQLETAGDVLRARRFPEDALDYYNYAVARGGNVPNLLNKMGIVRLELHQTDVARVLFERTVKMKKNDAQAWNNLGVTEYADHHYRAAVNDYKKATKLDRNSAVFHSNLGMAYFDEKDAENARKEMALAIRLDPSIMQSRENGGVTAHILGSENYPELCYEMAKLYAREKDPAAMKVWLARASEFGFDTQKAMKGDLLMAPYLQDAEVKVILANADSLRKHTVAAVKAPSLGGGDVAPPNKIIE